MTALILYLRPTIELTDEQFFQLCQNNRDLRLERTAERELIIMPPKILWFFSKAIAARLPNTLHL